MYIIVVQYQVLEVGWIGILYVFMVVCCGQVIMFIGQLGQGKSILFILFCSVGYQLLVDDIILLRVDNFELGYNLSVVFVKIGAFDVIGWYFFGFRDLFEIYFNVFKGKVKYLFLFVLVELSYFCQYLVLVQYQFGVKVRLQLVVLFVILKVLILDFWVVGDWGYVVVFMEWFSSCCYYQLIYSCLEEVVFLFNMFIYYL